MRPTLTPRADADAVEHLPPGGRSAVHGYARAGTDLLHRFRRLPTANIADAMDRLGAMDPTVKPVWVGATVVGSAYTVWTRPGDNLGIHEALTQVQPGDVIVVNGGGDGSRALIGELIGGRAKALGVAGFVIDGAVRDAEGLADYAMPVFARSRTPAGPYKDGPYVTSVDVAVAGVVVHPGDIIVGDADGVVVVPLGTAELVATRAETKQADEQDKRRTIDASLAAAGHSPRRGTP